MAAHSKPDVATLRAELAEFLTILEIATLGLLEMTCDLKVEEEREDAWAGRVRPDRPALGPAPARGRPRARRPTGAHNLKT